MSFLRRVAGLSLRDRVKSSVIRRELGVDPLLLHVERSQLRWFGQLIRMPPGRLPGEVFRARPTGRRPRTRCRDYVSRLAWERLGVPLEELDEVAGEREVWASLLRLLPPRPDPTPDKRKRTDGRTEEGKEEMDLCSRLLTDKPSSVLYNIHNVNILDSHTLDILYII